jgi:hypothetical protein
MCLEDELTNLDQRDEKQDLYRLCSRRYDEEDPTNCKRKQILDRLDTTLKEYDELMLREHAISSLKRPSRRAHKGYFDYIWNEKPVDKAEYQFIYHREDFVALGLHDDGWLGSPAEALGRVFPKRLLQVSRRNCASTSCSLLNRIVHAFLARRPSKKQ